MNMKKSLIYFLALSAIVGCQKSEVSEQIPAEGESSAVIVGSFPETKTSFVDEGNVMKTEWVKGDALGFYWYKGGSIEGVGPEVVDKALNDRLVAESSGGSTTFKTSWYYMYQAGKDYLTYLYYPYNVNAGKNPLSVPFTVPSSQNQAGSDDIAHLAATDFLYATTMANRPNGEAAQAVMVTFNHALSVLNIALTSAQSNYSVSDIRVRFEEESEIFSVTEGSVNLSDGSLTLTSGTPEISLHFNEAAKLSATPVNAYMTITPGHAGKTFSVYATVNGIETKLGSKKVPASGLPAGVKAALSFEVGDNTTGHEYTDLSANGTANCYLVTSPGFYKFKAYVKGNGVVPSQLESVTGETSIAPKSALVLWYNTLQKSNNWVDESPVYLSSVSLDSDGYIRFYTPDLFVPGNVVIAAFAEEGVTYENITVDENKCINNATLLWSWNIWAAEGYDPEATPVISGGKTFMDRNIGAAISGVGSTGEYEPAYAVGNYYQWGRKDPFPSISDYCNYYPCQYTNTLIGTPTYTPILALRVNGQSAAKNVNNQIWGYRTKADGSFNMDSSWHTIERNSVASSSSPNSVFSNYAVNHPYVYILNSVPKDDGGYYLWMTTKDQSYREFWGGTDSKKTLFDPCPAGWRVCNKAEAQSFMQTVFNSATVAANLIGYDFDGHYLPMTSSRSNTHFRTETVKSSGYETKTYMWTSETVTAHNFGYAYAAAMIAPPNYADKNQPKTLKEVRVEDNKYLASSCPVRCVKE